MIQHFSIYEATDNAIVLLHRATQKRESAEKHGADTTAGDSGILCLALAAQYTAEAQAWATLALALRAETDNEPEEPFEATYAVDPNADPGL